MKKNTSAKIIAVILVLAAIAGACYALYRYFGPKLSDSYESDLDDAFGKDDHDDEDEFEDESLD